MSSDGAASESAERVRCDAFGWALSDAEMSGTTVAAFGLTAGFGCAGSTEGALDGDGLGGASVTRATTAGSLASAGEFTTVAGAGGLGIGIADAVDATAGADGGTTEGTG